LRLAILIAVAAALLLVGCTLFGGNPQETPTPTATATPLESPTGTERQCPSNCDDGNPCTTDLCSAVTNFQCAHESLFGPRPGCTGDAGNCSTHSCAEGACGTVPVVPCCGNGVCEAGEDCGTCPADCGCATGTICCGGACNAPACSSDTGCRIANASCTYTYCDNPGTCNATCSQRPKTCNNADGCCPDGCDYLTDNNCQAYSKGTWANARSRLSVRVDALGMRICSLDVGREQNWLALQISFKYDYPEGSATISPSQFSVIDEALGLNMTAAQPPGDCATFDAGFLLTNSTIVGPASGEMTKLIYFYPDGRRVSVASKDIIFTAQPGERYIWLVVPS